MTASRAVIGGIVTRRRPNTRVLGPRQVQVLRLARARAARGEAFPGLHLIRAHLGYRGPDVDIHQALLGLEARGLIASDGTRTWTRRCSYPSGWSLTSAGHTCNLPGGDETP